ncbi:ABC transporter transmembrane region-domain-containing protein [Jimgerdemannia flammicorona]|uniref:ABC transporter transmembrane region-domain-containing protein n=1 Tax=Jimgerdemannia flammicorona TaxID=994334 RepID=A0A433QHE7_9FUNG|nr:ABC transporter transmembrane region-domain-containing protein [Jimgerdemannia flammicorona]
MGLSIVGMIHATAHHHFFWPGMRTGMQIRVGLIALMYRKCLTLSSSSTVSTGAIVNMISNDVQTFENAAPFANYIWLGPLEAALVIYFLYSYIGPSCFAGLSALFLLIPVQGLFAKQFGRKWSHTGHVFWSYIQKISAYIPSLLTNDDRVRSLSDVLMGINLVKLSAWEEPMQRRINELRDEEIACIRRANALRAMNEALFFFFPAVVSAVAFITFWALGNQLRPDNVFPCMALFNVIRLTMTSFFPRAIETISESHISAQRITEFLLLPELRHIDGDASSHFQHPSNENILELMDASFTWNLSQGDEIVRVAFKHSGMSSELAPSTTEEKKMTGKEPKNVLRNLTFGLGKEELLAVVGPVGR